MSDKENNTSDKNAQTTAGPDQTPPASAEQSNSGHGFVMVPDSDTEKADATPPADTRDTQKSASDAADTGTSDSQASGNKPTGRTDKKSRAEQKNGTAKTETSATSTAGSGSAPSPKNSAAPGKRGNVLALSALIIALGAAATAGYTFWQQQERTAQALAQLSERNQQLAAQLQRQSQTLNSLQTLPATAKELMQQDQTLQQQQTQQRRNLQDLATAFAKTQGPKPSDWLQAEAEYLLRLANHRLQLEGDLTGARTLLNSADERLAKADNPALFAVRQAIANELATLNSLNAPDQSGLYFKLSALESRIDQLPLPMDPANRSALQHGNSEPATDQSVWQTLWDEAKTLVVVRHRDEKITPLLPPEESLYLRHNLRLTLQQARIALLKEDQTLYRTLLQQAKDWTAAHFDQNAAATRAALQTLNELAEQRIRQPRPDISGSLNLLRNLQQQRFSSSPVDNPTPAATDSETEAKAQ